MTALMAIIDARNLADHQAFILPLLGAYIMAMLSVASLGNVWGAIRHMNPDWTAGTCRIWLWISLVISIAALVLLQISYGLPATVVGLLTLTSLNWVAFTVSVAYMIGIAGHCLVIAMFMPIYKRINRLERQQA